MFNISDRMSRDYLYMQTLSVVAVYCYCFNRDFIKTCSVSNIDVEFLVNLFKLEMLRKFSFV